jgi:type VI secretion system protein ImpL
MPPTVHAALAATAPQLSALRDRAALLSMPSVAEGLVATAGDQARRALSEADRALSEAGLYAPIYDGFAMWDGEPGAAAAMFGLTSDSALAGLVREWRVYAQLLARERAAPALAYLRAGGTGARGAQAATAARWREIVGVLADYDAGAPRNDLSDLERFVLIDLNEIDRANCAERLAAVRPGPSFFGARLADLRAGARARCAALSAAEARMARATLSDAFDASLAGRFPFSGAGVGAPLADPARARDAADLLSIRRFYAENGGEIARLAGQAGEGPASVTTEGFAARLEAARAFLAGGADGPPPPAIAFAVEIDFRANRAREVAGDQVVEWMLRVGDQTLSSFEPPRALIWRLGDPVALSLRWARNAPQTPAPPMRPDAELGGRTLTFSYDGPWALLAMIAANATDASELALLPDQRANALTLTAPLIQNPEAAQGDLPRIERAALHLRVTLRAVDPGGGQPVGPPLAMPVFPALGPGR